MRLTKLKFIAAVCLTAVITIMVALYGSDPKTVISVFFICLCAFITLFTLVTERPKAEIKQNDKIDLTKPHI